MSPLLVWWLAVDAALLWLGGHLVCQMQGSTKDLKIVSVQHRDLDRLALQKERPPQVLRVVGQGR